jgi:membrane-associated phospholipid phosphatase
VVISSNVSTLSPLVPSGRLDRLAVWTSRIVSPPSLGLVGLILVGLSVGDPLIWRWVAVDALLSIVAPIVYVLGLLRKGEVSDIELFVREDRHRPYLATVVGMAAAALVLAAGGAPRLLVVLAIASLAQTLIFLCVNRRWKISTHSAAAAAVAVLGYAVVGATASPLAAAVPVVGWSRLRLRRHDRGEVIAGALVGGLVWAAVLRLA